MFEMFFINGDKRGTCYLAKGEHAIAFDPGMAWYGEETADRIGEILGGQPLDAVFLTHSHYDHVAALPYIRQRWPKVKVYGAAYAKRVLEKPSARKTICGLSQDAADVNGAKWQQQSYDLDLLYVDEAVGDGDEVVFGDIRVRVMETIGHTQCSLSYVINDTAMVTSETIGMIGQDGQYSPQFLIDYHKTWESVQKSRRLPLEKLYMAHHGVIETPDEKFWQWIEDELVSTKETILEILHAYESPEEQLAEMARVFWKPKRKGGWPREAFDLNAQAMLKTIARQFE